MHKTKEYALSRRVRCLVNHGDNLVWGRWQLFYSKQLGKRDPKDSSPWWTIGQVFERIIAQVELAHFTDPVRKNHGKGLLIPPVK